LACEGDGRVMRLASCAHHLGIVDRDHRLPIAHEGVGLACEATPEGRELRLLQKSGA
jgi:hypothetical protein